MAYELQDNTAKLYHLEWEKAWDLHQTDDDADDCVVVDMMLRMRTYPDLSLYGRAWVNNLLAAAADVKEQDCKKFLDEALRLAAEMRRRSTDPVELEEMDIRLLSIICPRRSKKTTRSLILGYKPAKHHHYKHLKGQRLHYIWEQCTGITLAVLAVS